jgi:hypothetical protein
VSEPYHSPYDVPLPSPVGALIGFYEGSSHELSADDEFLLSVLWNLAHAEERVEQRDSLIFWQEKALKKEREKVRALTEQVALLAEAIKREHETINDLFDADPWIGYAAAAQSSRLILEALVATTKEETT